MIETMVDFRPPDLWPRRWAPREAIDRAAREALAAIVEFKLGSVEAADREAAIAKAADAVSRIVNAQLREAAYFEFQDWLREDRGVFVASNWRKRLPAFESALERRAAALLARLLLEELLVRSDGVDARTTATLSALRELRRRPPRAEEFAPHLHSHERRPPAAIAALDPLPELEAAQAALEAKIAGWIRLERRKRNAISGFGGELDAALQMPGWTNVWTMPIQNRVDMLSTGVNTAVGVRVLGDDLDDVVRASHRIAKIVREIPGAAGVVADPVRGKLRLRIDPLPEKIKEYGVDPARIEELAEIARTGALLGATEGAGRAMRLTASRSTVFDSHGLARLPIMTSSGFARLGDVASIRLVDAPATIKSENGRLRNYVRFNARGRSAAAVAADARAAVDREFTPPPGIETEWTGQFEHEARARRTLTWVIPAALAAIFLVLWRTFGDVRDAGLMMTAIPGALAGGALVQGLFGFPFSVTTWIGYLACFGMATSTGIVMLTYLRQAVAQSEASGPRSIAALRRAVLDGATKRLRPKLLTELATVVGVAPMLWADGVGSEILRPMAAPVLGGILIADEVVDLLLPVLFFRSRRREWKELETSTDDDTARHAETRG
jgi:Cu(I)/Ag(I) efflux system membrane protein CusA/SilA